MGIIEDKIKEEIMQNIFQDTSNIYDFVDSRFEFEESKRDEFISLLNRFNSDLTTLLKDVKLS